MPDSKPLLSVVVPVLNEARAIAAFIDRMRAVLEAEVPSSWEIVVVDDGSTDATRTIVEEYAREDARVRLLAGAHAGKGAALKRGLLDARGAWRFMADADLSMPPDNLPRFLELVRGASPPDVVIGSREAPGAERIGESAVRHVIGRAFNWIVRALVLPGLTDTQCGFKLFSAAAVEAVFPRLTVGGFAFDVEVLLLARLAGLRVQEVGISWYGRPDSRVAVGKGALAFLDIVRIRWRWRREWAARRGRRSRAGMAVLTGLVFAFAFLYRYNALGGSLGGFDGDHFIYYIGAQHLALGERPLRDFADGGLQGAWPALTYELPALAQRIGGPTLLPEAVLSVGAIALALAVLFRSAAAVAGPVPALAVAVVSLFTSTRLYGYPKVLVFSGAVALLLAYARRPGHGRAAVLAVWSAVAFLFRHDYLVYLAPTVVLLMAALPAPSLRTRATRLLVYGGLTALLLLGPLYSIERFVGVGQYLRTSIELTGNESRRTDLHWPEFEPADGVRAFFGNEANASAFLYYLCLTIPALALARIAAGPSLPGLDRGQSRALLLSLVLLACLLNRFFLRGNLPARFGDLGAPIAVLAAWLATTGRGTRLPWRILAPAAAALILVASTLAVSTVGSAWQDLDTTGLRDSVQKIGRRLSTVTGELRALPPPPTGAPAFGGSNVVDYLRACTSPTDRVLVVADSAEVAVFAHRPFAAGQPTFRPGFYTLPADQALMRRRLEQQAVPVVLTDEEDDYENNFAFGFPQIDAFLKEGYDFAGTLQALTGGPMRVFVRRGLARKRLYGSTGLPCFA